MLIAGYEPCSLSDYPGRVAAVVFTQGCNFRCPFCHNGHLLPLKAERYLDVDDVLRRVTARRRQLDAVVVSGGEPTLQKGLRAFLEAVRSLGLLTKLDTNGSRPAVLAALLSDGLVDYIAMDVKAPWNRYADLAGRTVSLEAVRESMRIIAVSGLPHEFRTTRVRGLLSDDDVRRIGEALPAGSPHRLQEYRPEHALDPVRCSG